jgi:hypothetical protein
MDKTLPIPVTYKCTSSINGKDNGSDNISIDSEKSLREIEVVLVDQQHRKKVVLFLYLDVVCYS